MRSQEQFVTLREELESIDEYVDIEVIRFGPRLGIRKDLAADTLDLVVPSLILQPLVENAIKHGLTRKVGTGHITLRSRRRDNVLILDVEDDGLGISDERLQSAMSSGIGLSNVNERLRVIYGATARVVLRGAPGKGATAHLEYPDSGVSGAGERVSNHAPAAAGQTDRLSLTALVADDEQLAREELCYLLGKIRGRRGHLTGSRRGAGA